jgi:hypothetical protein
VSVPAGLDGEAGSPVTVASLPARGRPPEAAARRAGLEFVEKLLTAMIWVVPSVAGLTRRLTGLVPCV